jgi:hypothetical protein
MLYFILFANSSNVSISIIRDTKSTATQIITDKKKYKKITLITSNKRSKELKAHARIREIKQSYEATSTRPRNTVCEISGSHGGEYENDCRLGCYVW